MYESPITIVDAPIKHIIEARENEIVCQVQTQMGVLVDKEELLRALQYDRDQYDKGYADGQPKWIYVKDRLPEPFVDVLCWYEYFRFGNYNRMYQTYGIGHYFRDGFWGGEVSNGQKCKVLAWMPLPEAPKGA